MKNLRLFVPLCLVCFAAGSALAGSMTYTGTLAGPQYYDDITFSVSGTQSIGLQTYGFGMDGTDPFLAIFNGTGSSASILTDAAANPFGTSLALSNYGSFAGCPPATAPTIGGSSVCGDVAMSLTLSPGTYTVVLSDGNLIANAVYDNGTLGEGFTNFTGGQFCNLLINGVDCPNTNGYFDLVISGNFSAVSQQQVLTPEPGVLLQLGISFLLLIGFGVSEGLIRRRRARAAYA
jgi:hypothetical protein